MAVLNLLLNAVVIILVSLVVLVLAVAILSPRVPRARGRQGGAQDGAPRSVRLVLPLR